MTERRYICSTSSLSKPFYNPSDLVDIMGQTYCTLTRTAHMSKSRCVGTSKCRGISSRSTSLGTRASLLERASTCIVSAASWFKSGGVCGLGRAKSSSLSSMSSARKLSTQGCYMSVSGCFACAHLAPSLRYILPPLLRCQQLPQGQERRRPEYLAPSDGVGGGVRRTVTSVMLFVRTVTAYGDNATSQTTRASTRPPSPSLLYTAAAI
jgi:hypothetical protein